MKVHATPQESVRLSEPEPRRGPRGGSELVAG
jgi:hypothetical protein